VKQEYPEEISEALANDREGGKKEVVSKQSDGREEEVVEGIVRVHAEERGYADESCPCSSQRLVHGNAVLGRKTITVAVNNSLQWIIITARNY
jgi:hypothetical protein